MYISMLCPINKNDIAWLTIEIKWTDEGIDTNIPRYKGNE